MSSPAALETPTAAKERIVQERRAKALAFIERMHEVTAEELAKELHLANAAGTISHLFRAGLIKTRELSTKDTYGNKLKLYSLLAFAGPWREYQGTYVRPFLLAEHWPGCPEHFPTQEDRMSVFTQLTIKRAAPDSPEWLVTLARPWWRPNYRHETHFIPDTPLTGTLYLRLPFYDPARPIPTDTIHLEDYLHDSGN